MTEGLGPKPFHGRIVMLVNEHTLSAGEMVVRSQRRMGWRESSERARAARCLAAATFRSAMDSCCGSQPPAGTWRGAVVEGKGVEPDVDVPLSPEGLRHGRDNQLEAAIATVEAMPGN